MYETPQQAIQRVWGRDIVPGKQYHEALPAELAPWYCYTQDGGHSICVVLPSMAKTLQPGEVLVNEAMVPAPVKAVIRAGYEVRDGRIWCELAYSPHLGLLTEPDDDEF